MSWHRFLLWRELQTTAGVSHRSPCQSAEQVAQTHFPYFVVAAVQRPWYSAALEEQAAHDDPVRSWPAGHVAAIGCTRVHAEPNGYQSQQGS
mmetsp:Transcript_37617/g.117223  ORF Transcript_37617/g.117223 Transcript_37617/m.117223 type:complete len:92 (+) Transcript_37617:439-714(+)